MKLKLFTVYDIKTEAYLPTFHMKSTGEALRAWEETCNDPKSNICKYPADFTLFEIGTWDDSTCSFEIFESKISLGSANEYKKHSIPSTPAPDRGMLPSHIHAVQDDAATN